MRWVASLPCAFILVTGCSSSLPAADSSLAARPTQPSSRPVVIVYSTARLGEIKSCGCTPDRGGLHRQSSFLAEIRKGAEVGLLEAGDTFFKNYRIVPGEAPALMERAMVVAKLLEDQGLLATTVGDCDLAVGLLVLEKIAATVRFPVLAANLATRDGKHPFPPSLARKIGSLNVLIVGVISQTHLRQYEKWKPHLERRSGVA
jgi:2',3'-cyclic-nucleotide 2'-phosphodiesterase (5'-nucleotidase family)